MNKTKPLEVILCASKKKIEKKKETDWKFPCPQTKLMQTDELQPEIQIKLIWIE